MNRGCACTRRGWLCLAAGAAAAAGVGGRPRAQPAEAPAVDVYLSDVAPGAMIEVRWGERPVFVRHRTGAEIARERAVSLQALRDPEPDAARVERPEWVVVEGLCTHGGCIPTGPLGDYGGWYCLCHGSQFDTAGRVRAGPARRNLEIPPYRFLDEARVRIGERG